MSGLLSGPRPPRMQLYEGPIGGCESGRAEGEESLLQMFRSRSQAVRMRREANLRRVPQARSSNAAPWENISTKTRSTSSSSGSSGDNVSGNNNSSDNDARNRKCHPAPTWRSTNGRMTLSRRHKEDGGGGRRSYSSDRRSSSG